VVTRVIAAMVVLVWAVNANALTVSTTTLKQKEFGMADTKDMNPLEALIAFFQPNDKFQYDQDLLARMILTEATNDKDEQQAMMHVVMNRINEGKGYTLGSGETDVEQVLRGKNQFLGLTDNATIFNMPYDEMDTQTKNKYNDALLIAEDVLSGKAKDNTGGATYFNQTEKEGRIKYGKHYFY
jgi:hypothetical protein